MGFKLTWLSVEGMEQAALFRKLAVRPTGTLIDNVAKEVAGRVYANGAYLVVAIEDRDHYREHTRLRRLSRSATVLVCSVDETCMSSHAAAWADGEEVWNVSHGGEGGRHLDVSGNPPAELAAIRVAREAAQRAETKRRQGTPKRNASSASTPDLLAFLKDAGSVPASSPLAMGVNHMFDVPIALCESLVGLRHDHASFWYGPFEVLVPAA